MRDASSRLETSFPLAVRETGKGKVELVCLPDTPDIPEILLIFKILDAQRYTYSVISIYQPSLHVSNRRFFRHFNTI